MAEVSTGFTMAAASVDGWLRSYLQSLFSDFTSDSRCGSFPSRSPSADVLPAVIQSPRRRPPSAVFQTRQSGSTADDMAPSTTLPISSRLKTRLSSIWSPHLRRDRRAIAYGLWEPPSAVWSTNRVLLSRQNLQPLLFIVGFIFPLGKQFLTHAGLASRWALTF